MISVNRKPVSGLVGVDIGSTSIKKLKITKNGDKFHVNDFKILPLSPGVVVDKNIVKLEEAALSIDTLLKGISKEDRIAFAVPSSAATVRVEQLDGQMSDEEIEQHIYAKLPDLLSYPVSEVCMDFVISSKMHIAKHVKEAVIVGVKNENVHHKMDVFDTAGYKPSLVTVENFAIQKVIPLIIGENDKKTYALIDMGHSSSTLYVIKDGFVVYSRDHEFGGMALIESIKERFNTDTRGAEEIKRDKAGSDDFDYKNEILSPFLYDIARHVQRSIQLCYSSSDIEAVDHILLCGGTANIEGLISEVASETELPVNIADPFSRMTFNEQIDRNAFERQKGSLLMACGIALLESGKDINLLPWREEILAIKKRSFVTGLCVAAFIAFGASYSITHYYKSMNNSLQQAISNIQSQSADIDLKLEELKDVVDLRDSMVERMKLIDGLQIQRPMVTGVMNAINSSLISDMYVTEITKSGNVFSFKGKAKSPELVSMYLKNLSNTKFFVNPTMVSFESFELSRDQSDQEKLGTFSVTAELSDLAIQGEAGSGVLIPKSAVNTVADTSASDLENAGVSNE